MDFSDKQDKVRIDEMGDGEPGIELVPGGIKEFAEACDGLLAPCIVRAEVARLDDNEIAELPKAVQLGMDYANGWLEMFDGVAHEVICITCDKPILCEPSIHHDEIKAFVVIQSGDLDEEKGAMVFGVCEECAERDDTTIINFVAEAISRVVPGSQPTVEAKSHTLPSEHDDQGVLHTVAPGTAGKMLYVLQHYVISNYQLLARGGQSVEDFFGNVRAALDEAERFCKQLPEVPVVAPDRKEDINRLLGT